MSMNGLLTQITPDEHKAVLEDGDAIEPILNREGTLHLGKMWAGLNHLLQFCEGTLVDEAVLGGEEIDYPMGYHIPPGVHAPDAVQTLAAELAALDVQWLREVFDPEEMEEDRVYPSIWVSEGEEALEALLECFAELLAFYRDAASRGNAVVTYIL